MTAVATSENALGEIRADSFDVLLCTVPRQFSGAIELISEMNTAQPRCICFALVDDEEEKLRIALMGRAVYIRKPISVENLVKAIREKLRA